MSLSPLVSFKSQFVTYLLNFPRILVFKYSTRYYCQILMKLESSKQSFEK